MKDRSGSVRRGRLWALVAAASVVPIGLAAQDHHEPHATMPMETQIPESMRMEHAELHQALEAATHAEGAVGAAAREVVRVLDPHFEREEQIALPPLGLLEDLAADRITPAMRDILPLTDALQAELPDMLAEHARIRSALERLADAARAAGQPEYAALAETVMHHARTEEEVTYPAAVLVGRYLRLRLDPAP